MKISYLLAGGLLAFSIPALSSETVIYTYDELGRLVRTSQTGTINNGIVTDLDYDPAGNRTDYDVTDSNGSGSAEGATGTSGGGGSGETPPSFDINDVSAVEGGNLTFTVTKAGTVSNSYSISYATANSSALAGSDYTATSGLLTFTGTETAKTITVSSIDDSISEQIEILHVNLSSPTGGATIPSPQGAGTISDNDSSNSPPTTNNDIITATCGSGQANVIANDADPDGDALTVISVSDPSKATIVGGNTVSVGSVTSSFSLSYTVEDTHGATATGQIQVIYYCL